MAFSARITRTPIAYDPDRAAEARAALPFADGALAELLGGVAGCSPYLWGLMQREAAWLESALDQAPEAALEQILAALAPLGLKETGSALRQAKRRVALLAALADCGGVWDLHQVTSALSRLADRATHVALQTQLEPLLTRGKIPGQGPEDLERCAGLSVLAMGKGGAYELNYSSDIDLICLFDDTRFEDGDLTEARMAFVKVVRKAMAMLSDITAEGYVFRTDLRLRPDPSVTPVAISMAAAERYYESLGRTWERAAYIKARPAAGDLAAGAGFLDTISPFVWRRHLDFATIQETRDMQSKIRAHKATWDDSQLEGRNLKLSPGGIREIEFFVQTRQLIAGGRDPSLRVRGTCDGLVRLTEKGWVPKAEAEKLTDYYTRLRTWEHRAQMVQDAQTHHLPKDPDGWDRMARFLGYGETDRFRAEIREVLGEVQDLTAPILADEGNEAPAPAVSEALHPEVAERWIAFPALRSQRARDILGRLLPDLLRRFAEADNPEDALAQFERFLSRLPAGVQLFSMFEANPHLIDLIVDIVGTAPALSEYLARNAQVLDAVLDGAFFADWPGAAALLADLTERLGHEQADYERRLDATRRWHKEWRFRIGVHHLRGLITPGEAGRHYADLAEATLQGVWPLVVEHFAEKHGGPPGRGAAVLGMGSLGAQALTATSDLDLIVIYDAPAEAESDGRRPLAARAYYARLTKALVTALSAPMAEGMLYEVDMRLRPSGRQGPVATAFPAFKIYQETEAWVWEHMALTRARPIAGAPALCADIESFRQAFLAQGHKRETVIDGLQDMRRRLAEAKPRAGQWDGEHGPGSLQDIELVAAAGALIAGSPERQVGAQLAAGPWDGAAAAALEAAHRRFSGLKQGARLLTGAGLDPEALGPAGRAMLLRDAGAAEWAGLGAEIAAAPEQVAARIAEIL